MCDLYLLPGNGQAHLQGFYCGAGNKFLNKGEELAVNQISKKLLLNYICGAVKVRYKVGKHSR